MNETYKKVDDLAHYVQQHAEEHPKMAMLIIACPDVEREDGQTLCSMTGTGANLIEMLAVALGDNDRLLMFVKDAVALVEGSRVMSSLGRARMEMLKEKEGCMGACDADNRNREYGIDDDSGEENGPNEELTKVNWPGRPDRLPGLQTQ